MKKMIAMVLAMLMLSVAVCAETVTVTLQDWLDAKGECGEIELTVKVEEVINPVLALVSDETASVNLFGVTVEGEFTDFITLDLQAGDVLTIANPVYNEYEGTIELADSVLVELIRAAETTEG